MGSFSPTRELVATCAVNTWQTRTGTADGQSSAITDERIIPLTAGRPTTGGGVSQGRRGKGPQALRTYLRAAGRSRISDGLDRFSCSSATPSMARLSET